jgi:hypothetical protein
MKRPARTPACRPTPALWALALGSLLAQPASAELVVLSDGHFFKVRSYELLADAGDGERMRLTLPRGGRVTLPLSRIERVVADEVPLPEDPPPAPPAEEPAGPAFSWRFDAGHAVPIVPYGELIFQVSRRHAVNPELVAAVVRAESAFHSRAISSKGARGLMQLMPATARRFGVETWELFDPDRNLHAGVVYLKWLLERFDSDLELALAAYNAGEATVDRYRGVPPFRETRSYLARIYRTLGIAGTASTAAAAPAAASIAGAR